MNIIFRQKKLEKRCNNQKSLVRVYGKRRARLIRQRLDELQAVENLAQMQTIPAARCHELRVNRKGTLSVNLDHPYRLLFVPANDPIPYKNDGGLDWMGITAIEIIGVEDTHE